MSSSSSLTTCRSNGAADAAIAAAAAMRSGTFPPPMRSGMALPLLLRCGPCSAALPLPLSTRCSIELLDPRCALYTPPLPDLTG